MGLYERTSWARGWLPDADALNGPRDGLLRADNLILDEEGVVAVRAGSAKINGVAFADTDVHSLATFVLSGTRYRMAGANAAVYANGTSVATGTAGSGDIAFGSQLGQIFWARSTTKKKYDGTTVRNWGISMSGGAPTVAAIATDSKVFASFDNGETTWTDDEFGAATTQVTGQDGTANGAKEVTPDSTTGRNTITKAFAADQDFTAYAGGQVGVDDDLIEMYVYVAAPELLESLTLMINVNSASTNPFQDDYYFHKFTKANLLTVALDDTEFLDRDYTAEGHNRRRVLATRDNRADVPRSRFRTDEPAGNAGWTKLSIRRGSMSRVGSTAGKDWSTVRHVRLVAETLGSAVLRYDALQIVGGSARPLTGRYKHRYVYVRNDGTYTAKSAPSSASAEAVYKGEGVTVTAPADASRDGQVNEIWVYRFGGDLDAWYRVKVETGVSGTGSVAISDTLSDRDALIANVRLETDNAVPPNNIIGIAGPYFDRLCVLTSDGYVYPSRRLNPDSFSAGQAVRVTGVDETPYWIRKGLGGLYIGTSKDIYVLDGDGAELPDGTINFVLRNLNIDLPPIGSAVAQEGHLLVYLASDGWRAMAGAGSQSLTGVTSELYRGKARHGVSAANLASGRFVAAVAKGQLTAITPEGASTTSSTVLYRYRFAKERWYRHTYTPNWRCVAREPDGTLIASDDAGFVWTLDTGTADAGSAIPIVLWTTVDDNGQPFQRKDLWDLRVRSDTGNVTCTAAIHLDGSGSSSQSVGVIGNGIAVTLGAINGLTGTRAVQLRVTGSVNTFRWYDLGITYREHPPIQIFAEPKPEIPSLQRRRFGGLQIVADTINNNVTVTPVLDDVDQSTLTLNTSDAMGKTLTFSSVVGRDLWAKLSGNNFELYRLEPLILETLPAPFKGRLPDTNAGYAGEKVLTGLKIKVCTLNAARTFTPILDGTNGTTFAITTGADEPDTYIHQFTSPQTATDIGLSVDGNVELYDWEPIVLYQLPVRIKAWEQKPLQPSAVRRRFGGLTLQINTHGATATVTPVLDGTDQTAISVSSSDLIGKTLTFNAIVGRDLWCRITCDTAITVLAVEPIILETLPQTFKGTTPRTQAGYPGVKAISGIQVRVCTLGSQRTLTPVLDGVHYPTKTVTSGADDPVEVTVPVANGTSVTDISLNVDGDVELYSWTPIITAQRPLGVTAWDSGPMDLGLGELTWLREVRVKVRAGADIVATPYFDGKAYPSVTIRVGTNTGVDAVFTVPVGRDYKGRAPRIVLTSSASFFPYWVEMVRRETSEASSKRPIRVPANIGAGAAA